MPAVERERTLLPLLSLHVERAAEASERYRRYVAAWPAAPRAARTIAELPYLPVSAFKTNPPLSLVPGSEVRRTLTSSATTGQVPSRIVLDSSTARRMTKGVTGIISDFIGPARRPYLVVDLSQSNADSEELGARGAAIRGLQPFANKTVHCLRHGAAGPELDLDRLERFVEEHRDEPVLVYGFTYLLWFHLVQPLEAAKRMLRMPNVHILHSGGWKRLIESAVSKAEFNCRLARVVGCEVERIIDFYGLVENVGIVYPDCLAGAKHAPVFGEVIVRDFLTLNPVRAGESGLVQVSSVLPTSFPGHLLLTEDVGRVVTYDGCRCGRAGIAFQFEGRAPKAEIRGCGNVVARRD